MSNYDSIKLLNVTVTVTNGVWDKSDGNNKRDTDSEKKDVKYSYSEKKPKKAKKSRPQFILYDYSKKHENPIIKVVNVINGSSYRLDESYEFEIDNNTNDNGNYNDDDDDDDGQHRIKLSRLVSALDKYYIVEITAEKTEKMY